MLTAGGCSLFWPALQFLPVHVHVGESGIPALYILNCLFFFDSLVLSFVPLPHSSSQGRGKKGLGGGTVIKELEPLRQGWKSESFASLQARDSTDQADKPLSSHHAKYDLTRASETELQCREIDFPGDPHFSTASILDTC